MLFKIKNAVFVLSALILFSAFAMPAQAGQKYKWKMATLAPDAVGYAKQMKKLVFPVIEKETNGELKIKVYWGGVMGDDEDYIKKMRIGQLSGAGFSGQGTTLACPEMTVLELPFLFNNYEEVDFIKRKMRPTFDKLLAKNGYWALAWTDQDFDQIYSTKYPLDTVADYKKTKFMTWYGPLEQKLLESLNVSPVPVNVPEVSASIRQGLVDAAIGPAIWVVGAQMYTTVKYVYPLNIRYSPSVILVTMKAWNEIPEEYRKRFEEIRFGLEQKYVDAVRQDNARCLDAVIKYGVKKGEMKPEDLKQLKDTTRKVWYELADDIYPKATLDELEGHLKEFREAKEAGKPITVE